MPSGIFISYRRSDSRAFAELLRREALQRFPERRVFMDVHSVEPGTDFVREIEHALDFSSVLVALIGANWCRCCPATAVTTTCGWSWSGHSGEACE